jgi:hypothetical protein
VRLIRDLADRVLKEGVDWLDGFEQLDEIRVYEGLDGKSSDYLPWKEVKARFLKTGISPRRWFGNREPSRDYVATRKILLLIAHHHASLKDDGGVDGVLIFRDTDSQAERGQSIAKARAAFLQEGEAPAAAHPWRDHVAIGIAEPKNEAWVLAGFEPADHHEHATLAAARQELGFAPNECPERLHASEHGAKRSAKDVLDQLCPDSERRRRCWCETSLYTLRRRGERCGLAQFLDEVRERLVPLFAPLRGPG